MFTIVIPVYNRKRLITRLLDSIAAQTLRPLSVIIVDNASTDGTHLCVENWISNHNNIGINFQLLTEKTPGAAAARDCGLRAVSTPFCCFFDSDDALRPEFAETIINKFTSSEAPDIVLYKSLTHYTDAKSLTISPSTKNIFRKHILHGTLATQAYAARTELFRNAGGWNPETRIWDDWELGIRILSIPKLKISNPETIILADKFHIEASITGNTFADKASELENVLAIAEHDVSDNKYYSSLIQLVRARLAGRIHREGDKDTAQLILSKMSHTNRRSKAILYAAYFYTRLFKRGCDIWAEPLLRLLNK